MLQHCAFHRLQPSPFVDEVCVEAMVECDAGNPSAGVRTLLDDLSFEELGICKAVLGA